MLYVILLISFVAVLCAFQMIYVPAREGIKRANEAAERSVSKDLDAMFVFIPVEHLPMVKIGTMCVAGLVMFALTFNMQPPAPMISAAFFGVLGYFAPEFIIKRMAKRRLEKFGEQLTDGLVMLSNGLRAGFTLQQAIQLLVEESKPPLSQEFSLVLRQYNLGMDMDEALQRCVQRTKDEDLALAVTAISITREIGGNLAEIFDRIVGMIRERKLLDGKVKALTSQGKMQAMVVACIPYVLALAVVKINPEMMKLMWTTFPGFLALGLVVILDTIGYLWVLKLTKVEY
jgi:tight adherence protein B